MPNSWKIWIDTGGTFTDCIGVDPDGNTHRAKVLSSEESAPLLVAYKVTNTSPEDPLPTMQVRLGTTRGTNALLERKGGRTALLLTKGFGDLLEIGTQQRPDLFAINIIKPKQLYAAVIEIDERLYADGEVIKDLTNKELERVINELRKLNINTVAIALMHSYLNSAHEELLAKAFVPLGIDVHCSSELSPTIKILPRAQTANVNAYLAPVFDSYLKDLVKGFRENYHVMTSAGGLSLSNNFQPKDGLLSGPAGGVLGAGQIARNAGFEKILTLDMGGTSTDVARYDGKLNYEYQTKVENATITSPCVAIETIAAGGGSVCAFDGYRYTVGPLSAGASPGPACYGANGPLTLTDVNLLLGRIPASGFSFPLDHDAARAALNRIATENREQVLSGFLDIANEQMAEAIQKVSTQRGYDLKEYALLAFGGAGGQHACRVAEILGIKEVIIPFDAGLLSAYGIGTAPLQRFAEQQVLRPLQQVDLDHIIPSLEKEARQALVDEGVIADELELGAVMLMMRLQGQDTPIELEHKNGMDVEGVFKAHYEQLFGHWIENRDLELESIKVFVQTKQNESNVPKLQPGTHEATPLSSHRTYFTAGWEETPVYGWEELKPGAHIFGPAIITNPTSTTVLEPNWELFLDSNNTAILNQKEAQLQDTDHKPEKVQLELFTNRFRAIAENMGALLQRTAFSVNVKERLDFSCALLDNYAELVVNAPHIPVHLGSLGLCTRMVRDVLAMQSGDVIITNHPGYGGSHLPDITLIAPVFVNDELVGYMANRSHHAEIGGIAPGSMPAGANSLTEEGVVIQPTHLVKAGEPQWEAIERLFTHAPYPTRALEENLADLRAALAAIHLGISELGKLCEIHSTKTIHRYMSRLKEHASGCIRTKMKEVGNRQLLATEFLDDGTPIAVEIKVNDGTLRVDLSGTGPANNTNLHATPAIVNSAVIYVLRLLVAENIPLNEGLLQNVDIVLPECILNPRFSDNPLQCPPVAGGNTETSQRLVDTLIKAFGLSACGQGTMNNVLFGNDGFGYYETIGGGSGAGDGFHGTDSVHQHMTNTAITDPEIMEHRYPVRLNKFAIRQNSGGDGKWRGGDGIEREITFLEDVELTMLSQHRNEQPYGLTGGENGKAGEQSIIRSNGTIEEPGGIFTTSMKKGDKVIIKTPGGGGYGQAD